MRLPSPTRFGPLFAQELARLARRGTHHLLRGAMAILLLVAVAVMYPPPEEQFSISSMARFAEQLFEAISIVQLVVVWCLTPWFASAVLTEEREQKTLDLLLTTTLTSRDIVVGKLAARLVFVGGVILAGMPIFAGLTLFGGLSTGTLGLVYLGTLLNLFAIGGLTAGVASTMATFRGAVSMMAVILALLAFTPLGPAWLFALFNYPQTTVPYFTALVVVNSLMFLCGVALAVKSVRPWEREPVRPVPPPRKLEVRKRIAPPTVPTGLRANFRWDAPHVAGHGPTFVTIASWVFAAMYTLGIFVGLQKYEQYPEPWMAAMNLGWVPVALGTCATIAGTISRERESDTLLMLLTVPAARSEILWRKCMAAVHSALALWLFTALVGTLIVAFTGETWYWFAAFLGQGLAMFTASVGVGAYIAATCRTTFLAQACAVCAMLLAGGLPLWCWMVADVRFIHLLPVIVGLTLLAGVLGWFGGRQAFDRYRLK